MASDSQAFHQSPLEPVLLGARYALQGEIARGGMGIIHRAVDRLTGDTVTIKVVHARDEEGPASGPRLRLMSLAHEFGMLASLRHPNVIRVFDYGFDPVGGPYFVMEHRPDVATLRRAAVGATDAQKLGFVFDLLRGLAYLHRRGIVHRDLKPENVLVDGDRAKIVDFGLSIPVNETVEGLAGTTPYFAPELLRGDPPSPQSDLWAVGIIIVELLGGRHPFEGWNLIGNVLGRDPDLRGLGDAAQVAARLLEKDPSKRCASAVEAAETLASSLPERTPFETTETRESFLQASRFVGRARELETLLRAFDGLAIGQGSVWLLGGESGVGKSRLADEAAIRALVSGVRVLRGQAVSDAPSPYDVWRNALRGVALTAKPTDGEAAILRALVPDIDLIVGRPVGDAPATDDTETQIRLLLTVEELIGRDPTPTLVILEDLQWAGSESIRLLSWLVRVAARSRIVILGTYREEEAPGLPAMIEEASVLKLARLERDAVGELAQAIIGPSAADDRLVDRLVAETEGNPFFLVETLRAISNEVGRLDALEAQHFAASVPAEGIRRLLERRLSRLPPEARELLRLAAVAGRRLDLAVLASARRGRNVEDHVRLGADLAILEAKGDTLEFAHDKLREALLGEIDPTDRPFHHARVAQAIESVHGDRHDQVAALAHHWELARDPAKSLHYAERAGVQALKGGAFLEAVELLERGRAYAVARPAHERREYLWRFDTQLMGAHYQLGDLNLARKFGELAMGHVGDPIPRHPLRKAMVIAREIGTRIGQTLLPGIALRPPPVDLPQYAYVSIVLSECFIFAMEAQSFAISTLRLTNRASAAGPSGPLSRGWLAIGFLAMTTPFKSAAERWVDRAITMARKHGSDNDQAYVNSRAGVLAITMTRWKDADAFFDAAVGTVTSQTDRRLRDECAVLMAYSKFFQARYDDALRAHTEALESATRNGTHQVARWSGLGCADVAARRGQFHDAVAGYDRIIGRSSLMATEHVWGHGMRSLARLRTGDRKGAHEDAIAVIEQLDRSPPVAYWTQHGIHAASHVLLSLSPPGRASAEAYRSVFHATVLGVVAPVARPAAALLQGELLRRIGRLRAARRLFGHARRLAVESTMPYEAGLASLRLAACAPAAERVVLLERAVSELTAIGAEADAADARSALSRSGP